jgi:alpha-L-fucosidase
MIKNKFMRPLVLSLFLSLLSFTNSNADVVQDGYSASLNKQDRLEWFRDQGFGLFIHWSVDSQLGTVISHSLVGSTKEYQNSFYNELPKSFNPYKFNPQSWASLAKLAGFRYVVFTAKHHSGFCMWDTQTTDFNIINTPFKRDVTGEIISAFRNQGLGVGLYHSPDDFWWLRKNNIDIQRGIPSVQPSHNSGLLKHDLNQIQELLTHYGDIDLIFFDGEAQGLRDLAWKLQPNIVVTRGAIPTPEQHVPGVPIDGPWESCVTMGRAWQYQPTLENYKSAKECLSLLIETRAKGGNFLLNIGPKPDGELAIEQEERLREIALWMFVNHECIYSVRPWVITNEQDVWFTKTKDSDTLYAIVERNTPWLDGEWKDFVLKSVKTSPDSQISILGQDDRTFEYHPEINPKTTWHQSYDGLHIRAMHVQRYDDTRHWPNPIVIKITHAKPALLPPKIDTIKAFYNSNSHSVKIIGKVYSLGDVQNLSVAFEYRDITGFDTNERSGSWNSLPSEVRSKTGDFALETSSLKSNHTYEVRAKALHPLLTIYGRSLNVKIP